jgi:hypothetical protein
MLCLLAAASWRRVLSGGSWGRLVLDLGLRVQYLSQEAQGYSGWYYEDDDGDGLYELWGSSYSGLALRYWVLWTVPTAGLSVSFSPAPGLTLRAEAGGAVPIVADRDDHVLRFFSARAAGLGFGGYAELEARWSWPGGARLRPWISLALEALALKANTLQTVEYYEGATEEPPGTVYSGIDHQLSTRQLRLVLACGAAY